jgi:hypothetical protein
MCHSHLSSSDDWRARWAGRNRVELAADADHDGAADMAPDPNAVVRQSRYTTSRFRVPPAIAGRWKEKKIMSDRAGSETQRARDAYDTAHDPNRAKVAEDNIIKGAWTTAFMVPVVGFVLGAILTTRQREAHGIWTMVVSTVMSFVWWGLIALINSPHYRY